MVELNITTKDKVETLKRVAPIVLASRSQELVTRFHFFCYEPWADIVFRFDVAPDGHQKTGTNLKKFKKLVEKALGKQAYTAWQWGDSSAKDDHEAWGVYFDDMMNFMDSVGRLALHYIISPERPTVLTASKVIHCALNSMGLDRYDELIWYYDAQMRCGLLLGMELAGLWGLNGGKQRRVLATLPPPRLSGILKI